MNIDLKNPAENYKETILHQLDKMLLAAEKIEPFKKIDFEILQTDKVDLEVLKLKNVIYLINIADFGKNLNQLSFCKRIKTIKETQKKIKLPKVNFENCENENTVLYVGKSSGSFSNRIKQHFGKGSKTTYSLQMDSWVMYPELCNLKLELYYTSIDFEKLDIQEPDEQSQLIELLETALHINYKPLLGRTGH